MWFLAYLRTSSDGYQKFFNVVLDGEHPFAAVKRWNDRENPEGQTYHIVWYKKLTPEDTEAFHASGGKMDF